MLTILTAVLTLASVIASFRRLHFAIAPTPLDHALILKALRGEPGEARARYDAVARAIHAVPQADWEHALLDAIARPGDTRAAFVNEQLTEIDYRVQRWSRVPRVCASMCASTGFLFASLSLADSLSDPSVFAAETRGDAMSSAVFSALDCAAIGIAGTSFCIAIYVRARRAAKARLEATDKLVQRLEAITAA